MPLSDCLTSPLCSFQPTAAIYREAGASWTAAEIAQQPAVWQQIAAQFSQQEAEFRQALATALAKADLRIILTGAGTSAYIGQTLLPHLLQRLPLAGQRLEAISSTDLVGSPQQYFQPEKPTLLVSYGRSGNSPESLAAVQLAEQFQPDCFHLIITCNGKGQLAQFARQRRNALLWVLPAACHDQSFAMTSSFTGMLLSTLLLFAPDTAQLHGAITLSQAVLAQAGEIQQRAQLPCQRVVFLGAGCLQGIAREAALKYLELTAGQVASFYESPLGFRHGPKSLVDSSTQIWLLPSMDGYTQQYQQDLLLELQQEQQAALIAEVELDFSCITQPLADVWLALPSIVYCQLLALFKAMQLQISADNPCPGGQVNRVVQGVAIYPWQDMPPNRVTERSGQ